MTTTSNKYPHKLPRKKAPNVIAVENKLSGEIISLSEAEVITSTNTSKLPVLNNLQDPQKMIK